jgi:hypothetical protein
MLHTIDDSGTITWHCHNPECRFHNCSEWEAFRQCPHHEDKDAQGQSLRTHISHEEVQWIDCDLVALPRCTCGSRTFVKVAFTPQELAAPNMTLYERRMVQQPGKHPETGADCVFLIPTMQPVGPHPAIARHTKLAELLKASGKVYE